MKQSDDTIKLGGQKPTNKVFSVSALWLEVKTVLLLY